MNRILDVIEWVKGPIARTTARRHSFRTIDAALAFGAGYADNGRKVAYSSEFLAVLAQGPRQTVMGRLMSLPAVSRVRFYVVTIRPMPIWEESEEIKAQKAKEKDKAKKAQEREFFRAQGV